MRLFLAIFLITVLASCQQEIDPNNTTTPTVSADFSMAGSPNNCSNVATAGVYKKNHPLTSVNKLTVDVNVVTAGTWSASTNTVNGISFSGSGNFSAAGNQTIVLQGVGLPLQSGPFSFQINAGSSSCSFSLMVDTSSTTAPSNIPPVANAGADKAINLPANSVTLTGSGTDVDGTVVSYAWTKISGPASAGITTPTQAQTTVTGLGQGIYQFELKVTDNLGAFDKDTVVVSVQNQASSGTLAGQLNLYAVFTPLVSSMEYDANGKIIRISSNYYPDRTITYANNLISTITFWYNDPSGNGSLVEGETRSFIYDASGRVIKINETAGSSSFMYAEYTYNSDNTMKTRKTYFESGAGLTSVEFLYENGNLTKFINGTDTATVTYNSLPNNFKNIYPQNYFLDVQTEFDYNYRSEIFYFSNNIPTSLGGLPVNVTLNASQKPYEVSFGGSLWFRYLYN